LEAQLAANGAIGEREAFEAWWKKYGCVAIGKVWTEDACRLAWDAVRAALTAEKVAAEPVAQILADESDGAWAAFEKSPNADMSNRDDLWPVWQEAWETARAQPAQTQVALTDDARECLADVVSHYRALYAGLAFQLNEATVTENADDMAYWKHEIKTLERMYAQAERALLAVQPVSGGKS
jgi:hypothetical protein